MGDNPSSPLRPRQPRRAARDEAGAPAAPRGWASQDSRLHRLPFLAAAGTACREPYQDFTGPQNPHQPHHLRTRTMPSVGLGGGAALLFFFPGSIPGQASYMPDVGRRLRMPVSPQRIHSTGVHSTRRALHWGGNAFRDPHETRALNLVAESLGAARKSKVHVSGAGAKPLCN